MADCIPTSIIWSITIIKYAIIKKKKKKKKNACQTSQKRTIVLAIQPLIKMNWNSKYFLKIERLTTTKNLSTKKFQFKYKLELV